MSLTNLNNRRKVRLSDLRNRIQIYGDIPYKNELGEKSRRFGRIKEIWASVVTQTGRLQRQQAETMLTHTTHKVVVRYSAGRDITKDMQLHFNGRVMEIIYIDNLHERNETIEIFCRELMD
ncbi:hypothetical protein BEP19_15890 [Ammoniphilus oxalaticus]|uniref:Head-tail adaptor protein n=1 Tax=Ammoniphilus oxalaticus TaxID=66863 RepID=A0A419SQL4_9BACL|nr:phage head closure protein [Ammoniphilus oxalaticus]RKD26688.1 hypothetical protein BEP19_15890 [Ammoniphilus oxalaticus]